MQSLSNGLTEDDKLRTITNSPSNEDSYGVTAKAFSEEAFIDPLPHYDYAAVGVKKVICAQLRIYVYALRTYIAATYVCSYRIITFIVNKITVLRSS